MEFYIQFSLDDPCELYCTDSEDTLIVPWGDSAADGTPCLIGTNDMCISGICRVSGCDHLFNIGDEQSNQLFLFRLIENVESWMRLDR